MKRRLLCLFAVLSLIATAGAADKTVDLSAAYTTSGGATWSNGTFTWTTEGGYVDIPLGDVSAYYEMDLSLSGTITAGDPGLKLMNANDNTELYTGNWWSTNTKQYAFQYVSGATINSLRLSDSKLGNVTLRLFGGKAGGTYTLSAITLRSAAMSCVGGTPIGKLPYYINNALSSAINNTNAVVSSGNNLVYGIYGGSSANYVDLSAFDAINVTVKSIISGTPVIRIRLYASKADGTYDETCLKDYNNLTFTEAGTQTLDLTPFKTNGGVRLNFIKTTYGSFSCEMGDVYLTKKNDPIKYYLSGQKIVSGSTALTQAMADENCTAFDVSGIQSFADPNATELLGFSSYMSQFKNKNCLFLAPATAAKNTQNNVIAGDKCANLVLTDGFNYGTPVAFTAANATYSHTMTSTSGLRYSTVILPYAVDNSDYRFFTLSSANASQMVLEEELSLEANKPYIYRLNVNANATVYKNTPLAATNASISVTPEGLTQPQVNGTVFTGTYKNLTLDGTANTYYFLGGDDLFHHYTGTSLSVAPFRAYFSGAVSTAKSAKTFCLDENEDMNVTSIDAALASTPLVVAAGNGEITLTANQAAGATICNASGMMIRNISLAAGEECTVAVPAGLYIVNGVKVIVK